MAADIFLTPDLRARLEEMIFEASGGSEQVPTPRRLKDVSADLVPRYFRRPVGARHSLIERWRGLSVAFGATVCDFWRSRRPACCTGSTAKHARCISRLNMPSSLPKKRGWTVTHWRAWIEKTCGLTGLRKKTGSPADNESELSVEQRTERVCRRWHTSALHPAALDAANASDAERYAQRQAHHMTRLHCAGQLTAKNRDQPVLANTPMHYQKSPARAGWSNGKLFTEQEHCVEAALSTGRHTLR
jgi:hypothetical protein